MSSLTPRAVGGLMPAHRVLVGGQVLAQRALGLLQQSSDLPPGVAVAGRGHQAGVELAGPHQQRVLLGQAGVSQRARSRGGGALDFGSQLAVLAVQLVGGVEEPRVLTTLTEVDLRADEEDR
ncbi:hypothetical protein [Amycolatopsis taiwanensis]|uniref:hypothetical protein n=1 Tax=Amycolatopsis taiwanensis TaxID=342230 RepID=UPI0025542511|nr:hypothetical protein [Amycolatopsis taiwanensis]